MYFKTFTNRKALAAVALAMYAGANFFLPAWADTKEETDTRFLNSPGFKEYPIAECLLLEDHLTYSVNAQGDTELREHEAIKPLTIAGARVFSTVMRVYDKNIEKISLENARLITPTGKVKHLKPEAIKEVPVIDDKIYENYRLFTADFPLKDNEDGSVIEYDLVTTRKSGTYKYWGQGSFMENLDPILNTSFTLNVPQGTKFVWHTNSSQIGEPKRTQKDGIDTYRWQHQGKEAFKAEPLMPSSSGYLKTVDVSNCSSWEELATWYGQQWDEILGKAQDFGFVTTSISSTSKSRRERVQDVLDWFGVKYAVETSVPITYLPHEPNALLKTKVISNTDGAMLISALLKRFGVDAYPILVTDYGADDDLNSRSANLSAFDRVILRVPGDEGKDWWINPTDPSVISECPPSAFQMHKAVAVASQGEKAQIITLPSSKASDYIRDIRMEMLVEDRNADIALNLTLKGETGNVWRSYMVQASSLAPKARENLYTWLSQEINKEFSVPTVPYSFYFPDKADVDAPFELNTTVISAGISSGTPENEFSMPISIFGGDRLISLLSNQTKRTKPIDISHPFIDEIRVHVELPKEAKILSMPADKQVSTPFGTFRTFTRHNEREAWLYSRLEVNKGWFEASELPQLLPLVKAQSECFNTMLKYKMPEEKKAEASAKTEGKAGDEAQPKASTEGKADSNIQPKASPEGKADSNIQPKASTEGEADKKAQPQTDSVDKKNAAESDSKGLQLPGDLP